MQKADAVVVIAFTRLAVEKAVDKPGCDNESEIPDRSYPTVWNQLEAAMAFGLKLPLLVIIEKGLYQEAMLKDRLEYRTLVTELDKNFFVSEEFRGIFLDLKRIAENRSKEQQVDIESLTVGKVIKSLKPEQLSKVIGSLFGLLSAVAGAAYWVGKTFGQ
jgi:hypothetical protein